MDGIGAGEVVLQYLQTNIDSVQELHIKTKENLPLRLTRALIRDRKLGFDEDVEYGFFPFNDLPDADTQRHAVIIVFEVINPNRRRT